MKLTYKLLILSICILVIFSLTGCASLLALPATIIGGTFKILGKILDIVARMPKPPPGVF